jgi:NAD(P)-dependent dehydrogenase (short-subunit alcohol dehydrogenase family)
MAESQHSLEALWQLNGKVALVTGGVGYLGSAFSTALAEAGATVIVGSRQLERASQFAMSLPRVGNIDHGAVEIDHLCETSIERGFQNALEHAGGIDILINNGHFATQADWSTVTAKEFTSQLENLTGYFLLARHMRHHAVERGASAAVIMVGSIYGLVGSYPEAYAGIMPASPVAYHACKGGVAQLTRHLAVYWAKDNVRVNCLTPGVFPQASKVPSALLERLAERTPMNRVGLPHELKTAIVFLASDGASFMTGQNLIVDGGFTAW